MDKLRLIGSILLIFTITICNAQTAELNELRKEYMVALHDLEKVPEVYEKFLAVKNPSAKILAYTGALQAIMTKTTWNLFKKVNFLKESEKTFAKAVKMNPKSVEIRFMRMAVQYEIPEYLGFSEDLYNDRDYIVTHIDQFNTTPIGPDISAEIFAFMNRCGHFTPEQIDKFEGILALNK